MQSAIRFRFVNWLGVAATILPFASHAEVLESPAASIPATPIGGADFLSLGLSMMVVVAVVIGLGWLYSRTRMSGQGARDVINIVASRPLGAKERLLLIEIAGQQLLVGMTAAQVQTLHIFEQPVVTPAKDKEVSGFAGRLRKALREVSG